MKSFPKIAAIVGVSAILVNSPAYADGPADDSVPVLHVNDAYGTCFFDLHPELTAHEFKTFAGELGAILRFRPLTDATTLGRGRVDIGVQWTASPVDDSKGAWNNTMSHPTADHYLGERIAFPRVVARVGVSDRVDIGGWGSVNPGSNYWMVGADTTIVLVRQGPDRPVSFSVRPSVGALRGPAEVWASNASLDLSVSRAFGALSPYAGVATTASAAFERSSEVAFDPAVATGNVAYVGASYTWRSLLFAAEVERGTLTSYAVRVGRRF
jgi:hypothetical protein